jgi:hypothetical protein
MRSGWIALAGLAFAGVSIIATGMAEADPVNRAIELSFTPTARAQIAIWIEKPDGTFLQTVGVTQSVTFRGVGNRPGASQMNSGFRWPYGRREDVLPIWAHRRAAAPGALSFPRVIFQNRQSEGFASRTSDDSTPDNYFCLSFDSATTRKDALDAVTCATQFNSDKGRFVTAADVAAGYAEPVEIAHQGQMRALGATSLYPPRRDIQSCTAMGCVDTADTLAYDAQTRLVMPDIDTVTMATAPGAVAQSVLFTIPPDWQVGDYVALIEVNVEGDYDQAFNDVNYPTPTTPDGLWDSWAIESGYPYRGQPSVLYQVPFSLGVSASYKSSTPSGYGDVDGFGPNGGVVHQMDGQIVDDPTMAAGQGADRLMLLAPSDYRVMVGVRDSDICQTAEVPGVPTGVVAAPSTDTKHSHQWGDLRFVAPAAPRGIDKYEVRFSDSPITEGDMSSFTRAQPAKAANTEESMLLIPASAAAGSAVDVTFGGMQPSKEYWVAIRAVDKCNVSGPFAVASLKTTRINFTQLSGCFVATAAYGSALSPGIQAMRQVRDDLRRRSDLFATAADVYYQAGPAAAALIAQSDLTRAIVRTLLAPVVTVSESVTGRPATGAPTAAVSGP